MGPLSLQIRPNQQYEPTDEATRRALIAWVTVTDKLTGAARIYDNAPYQLASRADTQAFSAPPVPLAAETPSLRAAASEEVLLGGRFLVRVDFWSPPFEGRGQALALTPDTGAFWFFDPSNLELMVKVLDGRAVNGKFWVFYGALSDIDYTLTVTDGFTGQSKTYRNPRGTLASRVEAF